MERNGFVDTVIQNELKKLNTHLPKNRKSIRDLLAENPPTVVAINSEKLVMKKEEIEALSRALPESLLDRVKLPLVLLRRRDLGTGAFTLLGDSPEEFALSVLLGEYDGTFSDFQQSRRSPLIFYKPQISELMRRFHSLIVIGFGLSE